MFDKELYLNNLQTDRVGRNIIVLDETTSTNDEILKGGYQFGDVVITNLQTKGKGRSGRVWEDNGNSLIFSICLNEIDEDLILPFNIIAGYSIVDALREYVDCYLKWPNDIVINGKKAAGMLIEANTQGNTVGDVVFGCGINIFTKEFSDNIKDTATSLALNTDNELSKEIILANIINNIEEYLIDYKNEMLRLERVWDKYSNNLNKEISIHIGSEKQKVKELGITEVGALIIEDLETGETKEILSGEIGYGFSS